MKKTFYDVLKETYSWLSTPECSIGFNEINHKRLRELTFDEFINNRDFCADFIRNVLNLNDESRMARFNRGRLTHIIITWLLGVALNRTFKFENIPGGIADVYFDQMWLQTAMAHDYGYLRDELTNRDLTLDMLRRPYDLLSDRYDEPLSFLNGIRYEGDAGCFFSYDYEEIEKYFLYRKYDLLKNEHEKNDHGIVGGMLAFRNYCKNVARDYKNRLGPSHSFGRQQKIACFIAASHNIFKSTYSDNKDQIYRKYGLTGLLTTSPIRVRKENTLLTLLSLVDTIECTKRFSAKENPKSYIQEATVLKHIELEILDGSIIVDFRKLDYFIKSVKKNKEMIEVLAWHVKNVNDLDTWTEFKTRPISDLSMEIFM